MQIVEIKLCILFLQHFLCGIMFTTMITCIQGEHQSTENKSYKELGYRLSKDHVLPRHYNIKIILSETLDYFEKCESEIDIEVLNTTSNIRLHSSDTIEKSSIKVRKKKRYDISYKPINITYCKEENVLDLYFKDLLSPGMYVLVIPYDKIVPYAMEEEGFIKFLFNPVEANLTRTVASTNIQSVEARKWFPCWDEPDFKTTFKFIINHPEDYLLWPFLPDIYQTYRKDERKRKWGWVHLDIAHNISTYQVMFTLTDVVLMPRTEYTSHLTSTNLHKANKSNRILSRAPVENSMKFSDVVIEKILNFEWYCKILLTDISINQLALPSMPQNVVAKWRLILYRESLVTVEELDSEDQKREVTFTVALGIVYQTIDNILTPSWWSDLWLIKGLAAILHIQVLEEIFPKWRFLDLFVVQVQQDCLRLDTNFIMKPLSYEVQTSSEIKSLFSFPIYVKAPVILRMVQHIIGHEFQEIIKNYLKSYYYRSLSPDYLWNMMQVHKKNPKLGSILFIRQSKKVFYIDDKGNAQVLRHWLPITFTTWEQLDFNDTTPRDWITPDSSEIIVELSNNTGWIIVNLQQTGYYRVRYDDTSLDEIAKYLTTNEYEKIHVLNRAQIIDDTYYFVKRGVVPYNKFRRLIRYLGQERDCVAWYPMFQIFRDISRFLPFEEIATLKRKIDMRHILKSLLEYLTYNEPIGEDDLTNNKWLRQEAVRWACIFGEYQCQQIAKTRLEEHLKDPKNHKLSPEWREWTYCKGAMKVDESVLLKLENLHITGSKLFNYLSCAKKPRIAIDIFFNSFLSWKDRYPTFFHYAIFVDYAVEHTDESIKLRRLIDVYNAPDSVKLLFIVINHLFSEVEIQQMADFLDNIKDFLSKTILSKNLDDVIKRRSRQIKYQKGRLGKLKTS
ncbi:aminopeptidase N-like isoform X2 [Ooceraea biroi]|uniref:aminopeptidase N-like isoform X2 n=1 Tax=Ooceraea biroi TaxID=2015173 RepID=UPI000F07F7E7|nr:aminopeptidase N-like isoform X2 [Ooceraea biroi]